MRPEPNLSKETVRNDGVGELALARSNLLQYESTFSSTHVSNSHDTDLLHIRIPHHNTVQDKLLPLPLISILRKAP